MTRFRAAGVTRASPAAEGAAKPRCGSDVQLGLTLVDDSQFRLVQNVIGHGLRYRFRVGPGRKIERLIQRA